VTLNDLERRNGRYFVLFQRIRVPYGRTAQKFTFAVSSPDEFLLPLLMNITFRVRRSRGEMYRGFPLVVHY